MIDNEVSLRNLEFEQNKLDDSGPSNGTGNADKSTIHGRKRWHVLRHIMNTSNFLKTSDEHNPTENSGHRDSFMERFSVQRRGSFAKQRQEQNSDGTLEQNEDQFVNKEQQSVNLQDNTNIQKELASNEKKVKGVQSQQRVNALPLIQSDQASSGSSSTVSLRMLQDQEKFREFDGEFCILPFIFDPDSWAMMLWLTLVAVAVLYNLWFAIARQAFTELQSKHSELWYSLDGIADLIYILDFVAQIGTTYLECGLTVLNRRKMAWRYIRSIDFRLDILSVVPMDMLQFHFGVQPMLRFPRFIKIYRAQEWKSKVENRSIFPNLWRVINLIHILFLGCHWFASVYFIISRYENFAYSWNYQPSVNLTAGDWTWRAYLKCFYWATLALTTIGIEHEPITDIEFGFTCLSYLIGLFIFATIVGQVGSIINTRNAGRVQFEKILDNVKSYMRMHSVRPDLQKRILRWYDYAWYKRRMDGPCDIDALEMLPNKLKTELALNVNLATLKKVTIFKECRPEFLHDLVLKMRPHIFTPGDYVCRVGEIAREMFIIADGVLEILSPDGEIISIMSSGDFFGEIGILNLEGRNRRTADVRAVGFTDLFVLSRKDVLEALKEHPDAEVIIKQYARKRLDATREMQTKHTPGYTSHPFTLLPLVSTKSPRIKSQKQSSSRDDGPLANISVEGLRAHSDPQTLEEHIE